MMAAMERAGAVRLTCRRDRRAVTKVAIASVGEGEQKHDVAAKDFIGKDAAVLARATGKNVAPEVELLFGETDESNPFVPVEQMMPFVPFVRCRDVDEAIAMAEEAEHGFRHTAIIHSNNVTQHDQDGQGHGHDAVRQERPLHGRPGDGRRRLLLVLHRHARRAKA